MSTRVLRLTVTGEADASDLPPLDSAERRRILSEFRDKVTGLALANSNNRAWWYTWLSSRDRYHCPLSADLEWLAQAQKWLAEQNGDRTLCCPHQAPARVLAQYARKAGWRVRLSVAGVLRTEIKERMLCAVDMVKAAGIAGLNWWAGRKNPHPRLGGHDTILVGWIDKRAMIPASSFDSIYFGPLPGLLVDSGETVLHFTPLMCAPGQIGTLTAAATALNVACPGHLMRLGDVVGAVFQAVFESIRWPDWDKALRPRALFRSVIYSTQARLIDITLSRLLRLNPKARVIRIYENLPWERAVDLAAHRLGRHVTGYLHCAVLPSHLNYYLDDDEVAIRPQPDRIVCTGPAARDVLLTLGCHDPAGVFAGMALRSPNPASLPWLLARRPLKTILILLEGLPRMVTLLRVMDKAARLAPHLRIVARAHPMLPLDRLAGMAGIHIGDDRLHNSDAASLEDAISDADAVVYQGTTAVLTAALMGRPLLWFDADLPVTDDPLFCCQNFKRSFRDAASFLSALASLDTIEADSWQQDSQALHAYVLDYLTPPSEAALQDFCIAPKDDVEA